VSAVKRRQSLVVRAGTVEIGGEAPVSIQSMTNTKTDDTAATLAQIRELENAGCELVRVAVPDEAAARNISNLVRQSLIPVIADVHFDARLAHIALEQGAAKVRINPGNIGGKTKLLELARAAAKRNAALRIGVNAGSLEQTCLKKHGFASAEALVESAMEYLRELEKIDFHNVVLSLKASDVPTTIEANRIIAGLVPYPLHLGVTEAGTLETGTVKAAVGIGTLLAEGIGDTIRVSLTADPVEEVRVGRRILQALQIRKFGPELISCPTCGRCEIDLVQLAGRVSEILKDYPGTFKVAVMGCAVNGPGEAREADIGVTAGRNRGIIFRRGKVVKTVEPEKILEALRLELDNFIRTP
jgi:(E)-4-hydroxy-3-methylbut-2-enyl-diphosphate synthase